MSDTLRKLRHFNAIQKEPVNRNELPSNASGREGDIVHFQNKNNFNKVEQYVNLTFDPDSAKYFA